MEGPFCTPRLASPRLLLLRRKITQFPQFIFTFPINYPLILQMEFWGVEVKPGEPLKIRPEVFRLIHISQAALGEVKDGKGPSYVPIHLKVGDKKYVIGTLSAEERPQLMFDLVLEREFELSHDWKDGSIYFAGYVADDDSGEVESDSDGEDFSNEEEDVENQVGALQNGELEANVDGLKAATRKVLPAKPKSSEKSMSKHAELKKDESESDEDDDDSDDSEDDNEGEESSELEDDSSDDLEDTDSEDSDDYIKDLESQKTKSGKKRPSETATEMLIPAAKKTKSSAPQKSGEKNPDTNGKSKEHNTKSGSQVSCKSCSKTFNSENALQSHAKAKHGDK